MRLFQINLLLAGGWCALFGTFDLGTFARGFLLAFAVLSLSSPMHGQTAYLREGPAGGPPGSVLPVRAYGLERWSRSPGT